MTMTCTRMERVAALLAQAAAPETSSDEMLIRRIAEGDQLAMRTLFGRHRVPLYRWLLRLVGDNASAEDLLSDVFLDVGARPPRLKHARRFRLGCWRLRVTRRSLRGAAGRMRN
jgi:RNA polymerase sigma-70 factor (ECF subfamily)